MIYVGIDIAKQKHFAAAMTANGEVLIPPFGFENNSEGFKLFLSKLKTFEKKNILIGLESTAHYGENLVCHLFDLGYRIAVINPIQTATLRKTSRPRRRPRSRPRRRPKRHCRPRQPRRQKLRQMPNPGMKP